MESSFRILRVRGIEIGANWSWLLVFVLVAWSLGAGFFPRTYPGLSPGTYYLMGGVTAVVFFASILLHELGHAFRALKEGMEIDGITLWLFGGVARFKGMFPSAGAEFRIAIAGPIVSVLVSVAFFVVTWAGNQAGWPDEIVGVTDYLARINAIVVGFNLVPALPLDGGRVLRSWLWHRQQSFAAATVSAAKAGRAFGWMLIATGVLGLITGAGIGGIWFAFLGWFLLQASQAEASFALLHQALRGLRVRDIMTPDPATVGSGITIREFLDDVARLRGHSTYPVVDHDRLAGLVSLRLAGRVDPAQRHRATVGDVMLQAPEVPVVDPDQDLFEALQLLQGGPGRAVVMRDGRPLGIVSNADVARALELAQVRGPAEGEPPRRGTGIGVWLLVGTMMLLAVGFLYTPPVAVIAPGEAFDVAEDITIDGIPTDELNGAYLLTSVRFDQPNGIGLAWALLQGHQLLPISAVIPEGVDPEEFVEEQRSLFEQSRLVAAAAAARASGLDVRLAGAGARVVGIVQGSPAADTLRRGDVIHAVDGDPIALVSDLQAAIRSRPAGTRFTLTVERDGRTLDVEVLSSDLGAAEGTVGIGVFVETRDFDVELPFSIRFEEQEIGGPSAGLAYALAVYDLIDQGDFARGRTIATTGTIAVDGAVGAVGGVDAKAVAAQDAGADLFLVPAAEVDAARGAGLPVRGVTTLEDAVAILRGTA